MNKKDIRKCRFPKCTHATREINIAVEPFVQEGNMYYHEDCYKIKQKNEWKNEQTKKDLTKFRDIWWKYISKTVNFGQLMMILNDYVARGVSSDYLLFTLKYCIQHQMHLRYPNGFKYYVDMVEIQKAYDKYLISISKIDRPKIRIEDCEQKSPQFKAKTKPTGFQSILN